MDERGEQKKKYINDNETQNNSEIETCSELYEKELESGEYIIIVTLNKEQVTTKKKNNLIKIYRFVVETGVRIEGIRRVGHERAEVTARSGEGVNEMIMKSHGQGIPCKAEIPRRKRVRKGVIDEWDGSLEELREQIKEKQGAFSLERLRKRKVR